jgi:nitrous oxidase accessory protein
MRVFLFFLLYSLSFLQASPLQDAIDKASAYSTLHLKNGTYLGNIIIDKPLRLIADGDKVILDAQGKGDVITIHSSDVCLQNLHIINSGKEMHSLDSAIKIENSENIRITRCRLSNVLYGINLYMVNNSTFSNNIIHSVNEDLELRGDGFKIWHSHNNLINDNSIDKVRNVTLNYSNRNIIKNNTFTHSKFGLHFSLSHHNIIKDNTFKYNSVSIILMGAMDTNITNNKILSSTGAAGIGLLIKGVKNFHFSHNRVSFNAQGIYIDSKSTEINMQRYFTHNLLTYNKEAMHFHKDIQNNTISHNIFEGNIDDIVKNTQQKTTFYNIVNNNYWDRYQGFDKNRDNIGDRPYQIYLYADQLWQYDHRVKFFYASPLMSILDFLAQIAPFIEPVLVLEDTQPLIKRVK